MKIMVHNLAIVLFGFLFAFPSNSATIFSYFDSIKTVSTPIVGGVYKVYYGDLVIDWDYTDQTKNPCSGYISCTLDMALYSTNGALDSWLSYPITTKHRPCMTDAKTLGELGQCLEGYTTQPGLAIDTFTFSNPTHVNVRFGPRENVVVCVRMSLSGVKDAWGTQQLGTIPTVCGIAPPPVGVCSTPDSIDFDHGTINSNYSNGNLLTNTFNVECNQALTAQINLYGLEDSKLKLTDGLSSALKINGYNADNTPSFNLNAGGNSFNITSELIKSGAVTAGDYQAQTVMVLTID